MKVQKRSFCINSHLSGIVKQFFPSSFFSYVPLSIGLDGLGLCQRLLRLLYLFLGHVELVAHSKLLLELLDGDGNLLS